MQTKRHIKDIELEINDPHYIYRQEDAEIQNSIKDIGNREPVFVIAPQAFGKHSLLLRIEKYAKDIGYETVLTDMLDDNPQQFSFYELLCHNIAEKINVSQQYIDEMKHRSKCFSNQDKTCCIELFDKIKGKYEKLIFLFRGLKEIDEQDRRDICDFITKIQFLNIKTLVVCSYDFENIISKQKNIKKIKLNKFSDAHVLKMFQQHEINNWNDADIKSLIEYLEAYPYLIHCSVEIIKKDNIKNFKEYKTSILKRDKPNPINTYLKEIEDNIPHNDAINKQSYLQTFGINKDREIGILRGDEYGNGLFHDYFERKNKFKNVFSEIDRIGIGLTFLFLNVSNVILTYIIPSTPKQFSIIIGMSTPLLSILVEILRKKIKNER